MIEHRSPGSHRDIKARASGHGVAVEGDDRGSRPQGGGAPISGDDRRYFGHPYGDPLIRTRDQAGLGGARASDGHKVYAEDLHSDHNAPPRFNYDAGDGR